MYKAIIIRNYGSSKELKLEEVKINNPKKNELFIRQTAIGVNYHDVYVRSGSYRTLQLPGTPGCEATGTIEKIGSNVKNYKIGDKIAYITSEYGAYATHRVLNKDLAIKLPKNIPDELIATNLLRTMTLIMLTKEVIKLNSNHTIFVTAATGGVGRLICQWAKKMKIRVFGSVSSKNKLKLAESYGCEKAFLYNQKNIPKTIKHLTNDVGIDFVYDSVGAYTFENSIKILKNCGHLINFGQSSGPINPIKMNILAEKSLTISRPILFHYIKCNKNYNRIAKSALNLLKINKFILPKFKPYILNQANLAHDSLEANKGGGKAFLIP